jgi:exopolysaccharide biosynthesis polyprenyl glycosylphosphotransferase
VTSEPFVPESPPQAPVRPTVTPAFLAAVIAALAVVAVLLEGLGDSLASLAIAAMIAPTYVCYGRLRRAANPVRVAVIGSTETTRALAAELERCGVTGYALVGRIGVGDDVVEDEFYVGSLEDLPDLVVGRQIDLLLLGGGVSRIAVFEELARSCQYLPVRLCELCSFYEDRFGHVPIAEINAAWFQCLLHPRHTAPAGPARAFDLIAAAALGLLFLPILCVLALLIRRDGGPVLYRQVRLGERGRPFTMIKLRTMAASGEGAAPWSSATDDRITSIGRVLRRTHIDELPQLLNVLRGEMSIVGPRPEQPHYVERLERIIPFYSRRMQARPGLTGWAQINCGYGGSDRGTMLKLSHDLYYVKHRSLALDVKILLSTLPVTGSVARFGETSSLPFVFGIPIERVDPAPELIAAEAGGVPGPS